MTAVEMVRDLFDRAQKQGNLRQVWHIVSALRGPDNDFDSVKSEATTPLRLVLLTEMQAAELGVSDLYSFSSTRNNPESVVGLTKYLKDVASSYHFSNHIKLAAEAMLIGR